MIISFFLGAPSAVEGGEDISTENIYYKIYILRIQKAQTAFAGGIRAQRDERKEGQIRCVKWLY